MASDSQPFRSIRFTLRALRRGVVLYARNRTPRAFLQATSFVVRRATHRFPPINAVVTITDRCQCRCAHCYMDAQGRSGRGELTTAELQRILDQIRALGALQVIFTGGEPLLRPDVFDLIAHAHRIGLLTRVSTNGYYIDRACAEKLKRAGLDQCGISIDDIDPNVHDRFRAQPGSHARAMEAFAHLREVGIIRKMLVYATRAKIATGLEAFVDFCRAHEVDGVKFNIPYAVGRMDGAYQEVLSENEMAHLQRLLRFPFVILEFSTAHTACSACNMTILGINPKGEVTPCPAVPFSLGSVRERPLASIWQRHASIMTLQYRGRCPLNDPMNREHLREHCSSVSTGL